MTNPPSIKEEFDKAFGLELLEKGALWDGRSIALWAVQWMAERLIKESDLKKAREIIAYEEENK